MGRCLSAFHRQGNWGSKEVNWLTKVAGKWQSWHWNLGLSAFKIWSNSPQYIWRTEEGCTVWKLCWGCLKEAWKSILVLATPWIGTNLTHYRQKKNLWRERQTHSKVFHPISKFFCLTCILSFKFNPFSFLRFPMRMVSRWHSTPPRKVLGQEGIEKASLSLALLRPCQGCFSLLGLLDLSQGIKLKDKQEGQAKSCPARPRPAWRMALESLGTFVLGAEWS